MSFLTGAFLLSKVTTYCRILNLPTEGLGNMDESINNTMWGSSQVEVLME